MGCDMCGKEAPLKNAFVEGVKMQVCSTCQSYGTLEDPPKKKQVFTQGPEEVVVTKYPTLIRVAREKRNLTQEQLAQKIGIKLSQLHKFESGAHEPDLAMAKKIGQFLNVSLITTLQEGETTFASTKSGPLTIADLLKK